MASLVGKIELQLRDRPDREAQREDPEIRLYQGSHARNKESPPHDERVQPE
jgi:hypothetical protein